MYELMKYLIYHHGIPIIRFWIKKLVLWQKKYISGLMLMEFTGLSMTLKLQKKVAWWTGRIAYGWLNYESSWETIPWKDGYYLTESSIMFWFNSQCMVLLLPQPWNVRIWNWSITFNKLLSEFLLPFPSTLSSSHVEVLAPKGGILPLGNKSKILLNWKLRLTYLLGSLCHWTKKAKGV